MKLDTAGEDYLEAVLILQKKLGMVRSVSAFSFIRKEQQHAIPCFSYALRPALLR